MLVQFILKIKITIMKAKIYKDYNLYLRLALLSLARD